MAPKIVSLSRLSIAPAVEVDPALERLVRAVLRPGLGDRFQLDVGRVAVEFAEVRLDRLHLVERQRQLPVAAQLDECRVVEVAERHGDAAELVRPADAQRRCRQRPVDDLLDGVVGQHFASQQVVLGRRVRPRTLDTGERCARPARPGATHEPRPSTLEATGSITPGFGSTVTRRQRG